MIRIPTFNGSAYVNKEDIKTFRDNGEGGCVVFFKENNEMTLFIASISADEISKLINEEK